MCKTKTISDNVFLRLVIFILFGLNPLAVKKVILIGLELKKGSMS